MVRSRAVKVWALPLVLLAFVAGDAAANARYEYAGKDFVQILDEAPPTGTYSTDMRVTGFFELAVPLAPNTLPTSITADVLGFSFADGRQVISDANAYAAQFVVSTDGSGQLTSWSIFVATELAAGAGLPGDTIGTHGSQLGGLISDAGHIHSDVQVVDGWERLGTDEGSISNDPGAWTLVPEPSTGLLAGFGLALLAAAGRRRGAVASR